MDAESIERVYSAFSGFYDLVFGKFFHQSRAEAIQLLNIHEGDTILEVGVGTGLSLPFYPKNCKVTGIDFCEPMLEKAKQRLALYKLSHIELLKMDAMKMEFPDNAFDAVFAAYVISAVPDPHQVISEMIRVCKVGGKIVLLNHFQNRNRLIGACEKVISPLTKKIGFRADLDLGALLTGTPLMIEKKLNVKPLNYWKVVQCVNQKNGVGNGARPPAYSASKR
ncbi:MAG TPA: methyltransferase domain-containing protein [Candidatus Manganitrophaceae bacterium]|nr:methyltransferase domain-containing protein [Candidatus Manganitrophaceae bacterium]